MGNIKSVLFPSPPYPSYYPESPQVEFVGYPYHNKSNPERKIPTFFYKNPQNPDAKKLIIFCHGNGEDAGSSNGLLEVLNTSLDVASFKSSLTRYQ